MNSTFTGAATSLLLRDSLVNAVKTAGLGTLSPAELQMLVEALAAKVETDPKSTGINPDKRYTLKEAEKLGYGSHTTWYGTKRRHLVHKDWDSRGSFVFGRDLLALNERAVTVTESPAILAPNQPGASCRRGRPRKRVADPTTGTDSGAEAAAA